MENQLKWPEKIAIKILLIIAKRLGDHYLITGLCDDVIEELEAKHELD